jgi:hypothetical protein
MYALRLPEDPANSLAISWNQLGNGVLFLNQEALTQEILPRHFKHRSLASFVRQLNLYGFRKVENTLEYWHANLDKSHPELAGQIRRAARDKKSRKVDKTLNNTNEIASHK